MKQKKKKKKKKKGKWTFDCPARLVALSTTRAANNGD